VGSRFHGQLRGLHGRRLSDTIKIVTRFRALNRPFAELVEDRRGLLDAARYEKVVTQIVKEMTSAIRDGHTVFWMGNAGSAADAQHMAAELSGRFLRERRALPSEALTVNTSALTAIANDFGYKHVFSRQIEGFVRRGDVGTTAAGWRPSPTSSSSDRVVTRRSCKRFTLRSATSFAISSSKSICV
jgi:phosphoheptose isomerase